MMLHLRTASLIAHLGSRLVSMVQTILHEIQVDIGPILLALCQYLLVSQAALYTGYATDDMQKNVSLFPFPSYGIW